MLNDFPQDEDLAFPISPRNSVLDTLPSLHRLSPSPTPSKLEFTWSSGDIPLILYDDAYIDERVSGLFISGDNKRESVVTAVNDASHRFSHHSQRFSTSSRASLIQVGRHRESVIMGSSPSSETICSAATFGTRKRTSPNDTRHSRQSAGEHPSQSSESMITEDRRTVNIGEWYSIPSAEWSVTTSGESTYASSATRSSILLEGGEVSSGDIKRSPSTQTWFSVSEWDCKDRTALDLASKSFNVALDDKDATDFELMPRTSPAGGSKPNLEEMPLQPSHIPETIQEVLSRSERPFDKALHEFDTFLRATSVQFLIDQEGFRDAEPSFKFCGTARVRSPGENRTQNKIMAQFRPVSRQQFHFHHAPFESPPVVRRITVNNDDTSDYVSRQAHLTLKSNGVFVIHGHEVVSGEQASEQTKLYWQFEYLVDDRRVESSSGSRRDLEGEKTFTPLTFSCTPRLLFPSQAKRINIMHVFRKSLSPKLVAEKLQVRLGPDRSAGNPSSEKTLLTKAPDYKTTHRRSRGAGDEAPSKRVVSAYVSSTGPLFERQNDYGTDSAKDTTSFARGSLSRFSVDIRALSHPVAKGDDRNSSTSAIDANHPAIQPAVNRHIVPPARLSELLIQRDSFSEEGHTPGRVSPGSSASGTSFLDTSELDGKTFVALSPRPKRPSEII